MEVWRYGGNSGTEVTVVRRYRYHRGHGTRAARVSSKSKPCTEGVMCILQWYFQLIPHFIFWIPWWITTPADIRSNIAYKPLHSSKNEALSTWNLTNIPVIQPEKFCVSKLSAQNHLFEIRDAWVYRIDVKELVNHTVAVYLSKETNMGSKSKTRLSLILTPNLKSL